LLQNAARRSGSAASMTSSLMRHAMPDSVAGVRGVPQLAGKDRPDASTSTALPQLPRHRTEPITARESGEPFKRTEEGREPS
jgi:hypothetical protein